jgi:hypothetical protein
MARNPQIAPENNFNKGLISEATGLNFPENASTDTMDCIFEQTGAVTRRLGFNYEASSTNLSTTRSSSAIVEFLWESAAGSGTANFTVVQIGSTLHFYLLGTDTNVSGKRKSYTVNIDTYKVSGAPATNTEPCQFTSGFGTLFVTHPYCNPFYVTYNLSADTITSAVINVQVRDFEGVNDGLEIDDRVLDLGSNKMVKNHLYNLMNQGWYIEDTVDSKDFGVSGNPLGLWAATRGDFPSNADVWWQFKDGNEEYNKSYINRIFPGTSPAPKGHYTYTAWNINRTSKISGTTHWTNFASTGSSNPATQSSGVFRPSSCTFYAGRVWYAGVSASKYNSNIYFSKIVESDDDYGYCMQVNDPTSENNSDLLPTDGGVIVIPEIGNVISMLPVGSDLVIFASNGVWVVSGGRGLSFQANDYAVRKLSNVPALGPYSIMSVEGYPLFWNTNGIYAVQPAQTTGDLSVVSLTDTTIKTFFGTIPTASKLYAKGSYDPLAKIVSWVYRSTAPGTVDQRYEFDRVLNLNTITGAFYPWTIQQASGYPVVNGTIVLQNYGRFSPIRKFLVSRNTSGTTFNVTWAENRSTNYLDWEGHSTGLNYESYAVTGYKIHGQGVANFQKNYVIVYCKQQSDSSLMIRGRWMYANNSNTGLWTSPQEVYNSTVTNRDYVVRRVKLRGNGLVCQMDFRSTTGKPFSLSGWAAFETANAQP